MSSRAPSATARTARPGVPSFVARLAIVPGVLIGSLGVLVAILPDGAATDIGTLAVRVVAGVGLSAVVLAVVAVLARRMDRRPLADFGITGPREGGRAFLAGLLAWLLPAAAALAIMGLSGATLTLHGPPERIVAVIGLVLIAVLLGEAIPEEVAFRGYLTGVLGERLRGWWIILAQTALFAGVVLVLRGFTGVTDLSLYVGMGIGLGYLRMLTGSVWVSIGFHTAFQTVSQLPLTHDVVEFGGTTEMAMLALGVVPFGVGVSVIAVLVTTRPALLRGRVATTD